ncbi:hypothetical protein ABDK56_12135 [Sphingomonas sp. ASV193]|uniref:hypothetical protein n=1 Tax=Sphingomonas sp. ASV193 TaxID=3144405 RepID=UPI0032E90918
MYSFFPQAGVRFSPSFTDLQLANYARDVETQAAHLYHMAYGAFARAADRSQGQTLVWRNFNLLTQAGANLLELYRIALDDPRIRSAKVGEFVNLLFWAIVGAAEHVLSFGETEDDWDKDWDASICNGGIIARLCADLALARAATGAERDDMASCLSRMADWMIKVRDYHLDIIKDVPGELEDLLGLANGAARLSSILAVAAVDLRTRAYVQSVTL